MLPGISQLIASSEPVNLTYSIAGSSPHSGQYAPENIIVDNPSDYTSRWSSAYPGTAYQWILLRLDSVSVLQWIKFGKFSKAHPCSMKEFKIFVGMSEDHMTEVVHSGLRNDSIPENFPARHVNSAGVYFPIRFVKIVPFSAHQQNYHTSIWHVAVHGVNDPDIVERVRRAHEEYREAVVLRHLLKHLRQRRLLTPFDSILSRSFMTIEHPLVTQLHTNVVLRGNWSQAEQLLDKFSSTGLFSSYLQSCQPYATFKPLHGTDADGDVPCPRGGHAMCIDPVNDHIYLHGGFDGEKCLDDFWVYDVKKDKWNVLSFGTSQELNAPGPRSRHKMVFDTKTSSIYLLGRLTDSDQLRPTSGSAGAAPGSTGSSATAPVQPMRQLRQFTSAPSGPLTHPAPLSHVIADENFCSEFYRYHTRGVDRGKWDFLSFDTASSGGPPLVFDHQMALDSEAQMLYVFGGRIVDGEWDTVKCAGMYCYNVRKSKWSCVMSPLPSGSTRQGSIAPRFGHSMLLDPNTRILYIFAGQRDGTFLSDMHAFNLKTNGATEIFSDSAAMGGPGPSFAQRAVIDPDLKEIYVISGLTGRNGEKSRISALQGKMTHWVYRYGVQPGKWSKSLLESPPGYSMNDSLSSSDTHAKPRSRYACQMVYNPKTKAIFIHGGISGADEGVLPESSAAQTERRNSSDSGSGNTSDADKENQPEVDRQREVRLNDLWRIKLHRPGSEMITRRAKFLLRSQQYREMCEEQPAVKALTFLQNEVANVVNHSDIKESDEFRSLMKHLLAPSANVGLSSRTSSTSTLRAGSTACFRGPTSDVKNESRKSHDRDARTTELVNRRDRIFDLDGGREDDDEDEDDENENDAEQEQEQEQESGSEDEDDCGWTNDISKFGKNVEGEDSDGSMIEDAGISLFVNPDALLDVPDPTEFRSRGKRAENATEGQEIPSGLRYQQRTGVFEALLEFIGEEEKQPSGSLLDLVGERGGGGILTNLNITAAEPLWL